MQKLRLDLDALEVASFETSADDQPLRGTVMGRAESVVSVVVTTMITPPLVSYFVCD